MIEMDRAEKVISDRACPPLPASLGRGESWPVAWHAIDDFAAVLFVQASQHIPRWARQRFDLLVAQLVAQPGGPFACDNFGGIGPGSSYDPFATPPRAADGLVEAGTAMRIETDDHGEAVSHWAVGWGRAGAGVTFVDLRTDTASVRVPINSAAGYFIAVAEGHDPTLVAGVEGVADEAETTP